MLDTKCKTDKIRNMSNLIKSKSGQLRINQFTSSPFENPHFVIEIRLSKIVTLLAHFALNSLCLLRIFTVGRCLVTFHSCFISAAFLVSSIWSEISWQPHRDNSNNIGHPLRSTTTSTQQLKKIPPEQKSLVSKSNFIDFNA